VTNLLLDDRVPVNRDEKEVVNYYGLLQKLNDYQKRPIDLVLIKEIHKSLLAGVNDKISGQIRSQRVVVGKYHGRSQAGMTLEIKHEPPFHRQKEIEKALNELNVWLKQTNELPIAIKAGIFHHEFVYIHPFADGNGRVCRLLTALIFIQNHYLINKYFILDDYYDIDRIQYSDMLHTADKGEKTKWLEYFCDGVFFSLQSALARVKESLTNLSIEERPTPKEREVLDLIQERKEITSTEVAEILKVSRQQAHSLLKSLVEKGLLARKGVTKRSYYFLK
jgi:Fic family protein